MTCQTVVVPENFLLISEAHVTESGNPDACVHESLAKVLHLRIRAGWTHVPVSRNRDARSAKSYCAAHNTRGKKALFGRMLRVKSGSVIYKPDHTGVKKEVTGVICREGLQFEQGGRHTGSGGEFVPVSVSEIRRVFS